MSASKHFDKIAWTVTALILVITILFMSGGALGLEVMAHTMGYEMRLFDNTRVHTIDIVMNDWDTFIANATGEEYYTAALVIDGEAYKNVAIRGKGNTSLSTVSSMNSDRYSFKVEFDHYDNSITYHGLDKLSLNNLIQDTTMMKDYLTYTMMNEFGAAAPLCSFVYITVNGEDWGLYLAVEGVEDSFLERNYGSDFGELYKPDSMSFGGGRGNGKNFSMDDFMSRNESSETASSDKPARSSMPDMGGFDPSAMFGGGSSGMSGFDPSAMFSGGSSDMSGFDPSAMFGGEMPDMGSFDPSSMFGGMGGFGMGSSDVKLQYIDDNASSYSNIWNNAKTDITDADQARLIESLKKLSAGEQIGSVVDIEQVIRYFVVHNYVCNGDSYMGSMIHNYYLYEEDGQMAMIPWDYNLAFGTFQGGNGQSTVNTPIDAPVSGGSGEDRPMWSWILSDEAYTELYHQYYAEFLNTVDVVGIIDHAYNLIKSYVEKDPTGFYTYEEFETGVATMRQFCTLRSESISMQLANGETTSNMSYVDASGLSLSSMGSMGGGMGGFGGGGMPDRGSSDKDSFGDRGSSSGDKSAYPDKSASRFPSASGETTANGMSVQTDSASIVSLSSAMPNGGSSSGQNPGGYGSGQRLSSGSMSGGSFPSGSGGFGGGQMPEGFDPSQMPGGFGGGFGDSAETTPSDNAGGKGSSGSGSRPSFGGGQMPGGDFNFGGGMGSSAQNNASWVWLAASVLILGVGLIIAKVYRY